MDGDVAGPVCLVKLGGDLFPAVDFFRLIILMRDISYLTTDRELYLTFVGNYLFGIFNLIQFLH